MKVTIIPVGVDPVLLPFPIEVNPVEPFTELIRKALQVMLAGNVSFLDKRFDICTGSAGLPIEPGEFSQDVASMKLKYGGVFCIQPGRSFNGAGHRD